jgi:hypothetical protein
MAVSELPGNPNAVWTVRLNKSGKKCSQYCTSMPRVIVEELRDISNKCMPCTINVVCHLAQHTYCKPEVTVKSQL